MMDERLSTTAALVFGRMTVRGSMSKVAMVESLFEVSRDDVCVTQGLAPFNNERESFGMRTFHASQLPSGVEGDGSRLVDLATRPPFL